MRGVLPPDSCRGGQAISADEQPRYRPLIQRMRPRHYDRFAPETVSSPDEIDCPDTLQCSQPRSGSLAKALLVNKQALRLQHTGACARNFGHGSDTGLRKDKGVSGHSPANPVILGSPTWARTRDLRINRSWASTKITAQAALVPRLQRRCASGRSAARSWRRWFRKSARR